MNFKIDSQTRANYVSKVCSAQELVSNLDISEMSYFKGKYSLSDYLIIAPNCDNIYKFAIMTIQYADVFSQFLEKCTVAVDMCTNPFMGWCDLICMVENNEKIVQDNCKMFFKKFINLEQENSFIGEFDKFFSNCFDKFILGYDNDLEFYKLLKIPKIRPISNKFVEFFAEGYTIFKNEADYELCKNEMLAAYSEFTKVATAEFELMFNTQLKNLKTFKKFLSCEFKIEKNEYNFSNFLVLISATNK